MKMRNKFVPSSFTVFTLVKRQGNYKISLEVRDVTMDFYRYFLAYNKNMHYFYCKEHLVSPVVDKYYYRRD